LLVLHLTQSSEIINRDSDLDCLNLNNEAIAQQSLTHRWWRAVRHRRSPGAV